MRAGRTVVAKLGITVDELTAMIESGRGGVSFAGVPIPLGARFVAAYHRPMGDSVDALFYAEAEGEVRSELRNLLLVPLQHGFPIEPGQTVTPLCALSVGPAIFTLFEVHNAPDANTN